MIPDGTELVKVLHAEVELASAIEERDTYALTPIKPAAIVMYHLLARDQLSGSSGSFGSNCTSYSEESPFSFGTGWCNDFATSSSLQRSAEVEYETCS